MYSSACTKVLFTVRYSKRQITALTFVCHYKNNNKNHREKGLLSLSNLEMCIKKAEFFDLKRLKSEFKGQIASKFDLGLHNAYNPMYFDRNIIENKELHAFCSYKKWSYKKH